MSQKAPPWTKMWGKIPGTSHLQTPWAKNASTPCYGSAKKVNFVVFFAFSHHPKIWLSQVQFSHSNRPLPKKLPISPNLEKRAKILIFSEHFCQVERYSVRFYTIQIFVEGMDGPKKNTRILGVANGRQKKFAKNLRNFAIFCEILRYFAKFCDFAIFCDILRRSKFPPP